MEGLNGSPTAAAAHGLHMLSWKYGGWQGADSPGPLQKTADLGGLECLVAGQCDSSFYPSSSIDQYMGVLSRGTFCRPAEWLQ